MKLSIIFVVAVTVVFIPHTTCAQEKVIISTYYPAPYGEYDQLMAESLLMDPEDDDPDDKNLIGIFDNNSLYEHKLRITAGRNDTENNIEGACIELHGNDYGAWQKAGDLDFLAGRGSAGGPYGDIRFYTSEHPAVANILGVPRMLIHSSGNVHIGTLLGGLPQIDPDAMLTTGSGAGKYNVVIRGPAAGPKIFFDEWDGFGSYVEAGVFGIDGADDAFVIRQITNSGTAALLLDVQSSAARGVAGSSLLSVLHNGNVGIGTNTPTAGLHVTDPTINPTPGVEGVQIAGGAASSLDITSNALGSLIDFNNLAEVTRDYTVRLGLDPSFDGVLGVTFAPGAADPSFVVNGYHIITQGLGIGLASISAPLHVANLGTNPTPFVPGVQIGGHTPAWKNWGLEITAPLSGIAYIDFQGSVLRDYDARIFLWMTNFAFQTAAKPLNFHANTTSVPGPLTVGGFTTFQSDVHVDGDLSCDGAKFVIDHPTKPGLELIHTSIEGPEAGLYYRGDAELVNGQALIRLPEYFETLTRPEDRAVLLTAKGREPFLLSYTDIVDGKFTVYGTRPDGEFSWEVKAVRADIEPLVIERPKVPRKEIPELPDFLTQQTPSSNAQ